MGEHAEGGDGTVRWRPADHNRSFCFTRCPCSSRRYSRYCWKNFSSVRNTLSRPDLMRCNTSHAPLCSHWDISRPPLITSDWPHNSGPMRPSIVGTDGDVHRLQGDASAEPLSTCFAPATQPIAERLGTISPEPRRGNQTSISSNTHASPYVLFRDSPHPVAPKPNTTVPLSLVGLPFPNDNEIVHARVYLSYNRAGVPPASEFERGIQIWIGNLRDHAVNCHGGKSRQQPSPGDRGHERLPLRLAHLIAVHLPITFSQITEILPQHRQKRPQEQQKQHCSNDYRSTIRLALKFAQSRPSEHCRGQ